MGEILSFQLARDEFHRKLGGGLPKGSLVLIEGEHGSGKSVVLQRMAYGFLNNNHSVTIISTQQTTRDFIYQMFSLDYGVLTFLVNGSLLYIPVYPLMSETKPRDDFLDKLMGAKALFEKDVVFIDTLSSLIKNSTTDEDKVIDLISFFKRLTGVGKTIILTMDEGQLDENIMEMFRACSTVYLTVKYRILGSDVKHYIMVNKYLGASQQFSRIIGFRVEPKIGFVVEITSVA